VSISIVLGGRSPVADALLEHHRAHYRPRVRMDDPPPVVVRPAPPASATLSLGAAVTQVLVVRVVVCMVLWAAGGTVYGFWQLGNALAPTTPRGGIVTCSVPRAIGSLPGC
jgi:hypothetical protein